MTRRQLSRIDFARLWVLVASGLGFSCGADAATPPEQAQVGLPQPESGEALPQSGCDITLRIADASGCRGEWVCAETVARSLLCAVADGVLYCSCKEGGDDDDVAAPIGAAGATSTAEPGGAAGAAGATGGATAPLSTTEPCATAEEVSAVATSVCGWDVP